MPRAALLSIHARVTSADAAGWEHPSLVQLWGPRYAVYVVAARDRAVFSLGRLPDDARRGARASDTATRLHQILDGRRLSFGAAGRALGVAPNSLRYAATTGTVLLRWDGARQPVVWTVPAAAMDPRDARLELARRYLHVFGPATVASFAHWAGVVPVQAHAVFTALAKALLPVRTPLGDAWILAADEGALRAPAGPAAPARLLPSGDAYYLCWGPDRNLLVPEAKRQATLWTTRVWAGALLVGGDIVGTWRRSAANVVIEAWRPLTSAERHAVEGEALSLPLPGLDRPVAIGWS